MQLKGTQAITLRKEHHMIGAIVNKVYDILDARLGKITRDFMDKYGV
jgi:hypothetical protein